MARTPDNLPKRLEALNRATPSEQQRRALADLRRRLAKRDARSTRPQETPATTGPALPAIVYRRDLPRSGPPPARRAAAGPALSLEEAVKGEERIAPDGGRAYVAAQSLAAMGKGFSALERAFHEALTYPDSNLNRRLRHEGYPGPLAPDRLLFLDIETTGLIATPLFLIGTLVWEGGLVVRQYLARTYAEEGAVIALLAEAMRGRRTLVSFNGKTYDLPYVRARAAATRAPLVAPEIHLDMLHLARRVWRERLPDCRLQTLETFICGRVRRGDIPGHLIPDAYHEYVRTGNAAQIGEIVRHNRHDLITLADLMTRVPAPPDPCRRPDGRGASGASGAGGD